MQLTLWSILISVLSVLMMNLGNALAQCWGNDDHAVYNTHASKTVLRALVWALKCLMTSWHRLMSNWCSNRFLTDNRRCCGGKTVECNTCSSSTRPYLLLEGQEVFFQSNSKFWCLWMLVEKAIFSVLLVVWAILHLLQSEHILACVIVYPTMISVAKILST